MHSDAVATESAMEGSFFVQLKQTEEKNANSVFQKVFRALCWMGKEELPSSKATSLLTLLEKMGLEEIKRFRTRSEHVLREMMLTLSQVIQEELLKKIRKV